MVKRVDLRRGWQEFFVLTRLIGEYFGKSGFLVIELTIFIITEYPINQLITTFVFK